MAVTITVTVTITDHDHGDGHDHGFDHEWGYSFPSRFSGLFLGESPVQRVGKEDDYDS